MTRSVTATALYLALLCAVALPAPRALAQETTERYVVRFKESSARARVAAARREEYPRTEAAFDLPTVAVLPDDNAVVATLSKAEAEALALHQDVETVERDVPMYGSAIPNDPFLSQLTSYDIYPGANILPSWNITTGSTQALVAVMDSGVDYTHPDLRGAMWTNPGEVRNNGRDDDGNGLVDDYHGYDFVNRDGDPRDDSQHGTHVAGTVAARGDNGKGVIGIAWGTQVIAIKVLDANGDGFASDIVRAMDYVGTLRKQGIPIVALNMSLGGDYSKALERAVRRALFNDILIIAAAGNASVDIDSDPVYPASFRMPNVISVAAIDGDGNLATFSNFGRRNVTLSAPGTDVLSTVPRDTTGVFYKKLNGTSMATPHVAGAAALVAAVNRNLTAPLIRSVLLGTARDNPALKNLASTEGVVDAAAAVSQAPSAPSKFKLYGRVLNGSQGVSNAWVTARADGKRTRRTLTRSNGGYTFSRLAAGSYRITVTKAGVSFSQPSASVLFYRKTQKNIRVRTSR